MPSRFVTENCINRSADKPAVEQIARRLMQAGIQPWLDTWNLVPGDPWQEGLEEALDTSRACVVFLGPSGVAPWHNEELRVALDRVPEIARAASE